MEHRATVRPLQESRLAAGPASQTRCSWAQQRCLALTADWRHHAVSTQYLHSIYTVSTQYLHSIYTVSIQYLHSMYTAVLCSLLSGRVFSCCHGHTSGQHGHSGKLKSPQIVIVEAKSIFITITRGHGLLFYWVYLPTILCVRACVCYVTMCKM